MHRLFHRVLELIRASLSAARIWPQLLMEVVASHSICGDSGKLPRPVKSPVTGDLGRTFVWECR
jgi:hypothetical protein